jgi:hypothetical protein
MSERALPRPPGGWLPWFIVPGVLLVFAGANAHLVYVAFQSQPECVAHLKSAGEGSSYRAAKSAC